MSKFCENCGSELKETDTTCPNCGAAVEKTTKKDVEVNNTNTTANTTTSNTATNEVKEKKNNTKKTDMTNNTNKHTLPIWTEVEYTALCKNPYLSSDLSCCYPLHNRQTFR